MFSYDATALVRNNTRFVGIPFERVVSHVYPLERISEGFEQANWMQRGNDPLKISRAAVSV